MELIIEKLLPIFLFFIIGFGLQKFKVLKREDALIFLKLIFYLLSPAVIIISVSQMHITKELLYFLLAAISMHIFMYELGLFLLRFQKLNLNEEKIYRGGALIMNMTFILPFFLTFFGETNVYYFSMFDAGNLIMITTIVYSIFVSKEDAKLKDKILSILSSPLVIALIIGILLNLLKIKIPNALNYTITQIAKMTGTFIMIALGLYFTPKFSKLKLSLKIIVTKILGMLIVATVISNILPIGDMGKILMYLGALSPIGNNVLTFTYISDGDMELATNVISLSIIISFINLSIFFLFFS